MFVSEIVAARTSRVVEVPDPEPSASQILVDVVASGVCTSDLMPWTTGPGGAAPLRMGHEIVGRVRTADDAGRWNAGDLVTGLGDGGFAERAVMDADAVRPVPIGVEPALAIGEPIADLEEAIARSAVHPGDRVAVVGLGFMGLGLVQLARARGAGLILGVDPRPESRSRALATGADLASAPDELPAEMVSDTDRAHDARFDVVLEATGRTAGLETAGTLVRPFGTLCVVGYHHDGTAPMDMGLWYKGATIVNGFCPDRRRLVRAMDDALELVRTRAFTYAPLITHRFGLDGVDEAYTLMADRDPSFVKAVLQPTA